MSKDKHDVPEPEHNTFPMKAIAKAEKTKAKEELKAKEAEKEEPEPWKPKTNEGGK